MIDTHCHIHDEEFGFDFAEAAEQAKSDGVEKLICIGTDLRSSKQAAEKCDSKFSFPTVGLHPHDASQLQSQKDQLAALVNDNTVAIGECGLDYFYLNSDKIAQEKAFRWQIELSQQNDLPLSLHIRGSKEQSDDAVNDALDIMSDYQGLRGVVHSFYLDYKTAKKFHDKGFYLGLNGIITFSNEAHMSEMLEKIELGQVVLETDAPFLAPKPYRGKTNKPGWVRLVAKHLAEHRNMPLDQVIDITSANAKELFKLR